MPWTDQTWCVFIQVNLKPSAAASQQRKEWGLEGMATLSKAVWKALGVGRARIERDTRRTGRGKAGKRWGGCCVQALEGQDSW